MKNNKSRIEEFDDSKSIILGFVTGSNVYYLNDDMVTYIRNLINKDESKNSIKISLPCYTQEEINYILERGDYYMNNYSHFNKGYAMSLLTFDFNKKFNCNRSISAIQTKYTRLKNKEIN